MRYADVAVSVPAQPGRRRSASPTEAETGIFSYSVPDQLEARVQIGQWVWVPFGTRHLAGVVLGLSSEPPPLAVRPLADVLEEAPALGPEQLSVARWMSRYYLAPLFDCVALFLPPGSVPRTECLYEAGSPSGDLTAFHEHVLGLLRAQGPLTEEGFRAALQRASLDRKERLSATAAAAAMETLVQQGTVRRFWRPARPRTEPNLLPRVQLLVDEATALRRMAEKAARSAQSRLLLALAATQAAGDPLQSLAGLAADLDLDALRLSKLAEHDMVSLVQGETVWQVSDSGAAAEAVPEWVRRGGARTADEWTRAGLEHGEVERLVETGLLTSHSVPDQLALRVEAVEAWESVVERDGSAASRRALAALARLGGAAWLRDLTRVAACTRANVERLVDLGVVAIAAARFYRDPFLKEAGDPAPLPALTEEQRDALEPIVAALAAGQQASFLLQGVTGSGKTEVYLHAVERALALGRQSIVLVPEIALTPQTLSRFGRHFPGRVAVQHSGLRPGQRYDQWTRVQDGEADVVVGPRSALFMPLPRCGLIIIDEEHESSYKQDSRPHYHARDVALRLARETGAVVVLGSATPDVTTYRAAERGALQLLRLTERYGGAQPLALPPVQVVDMRAELRDGHTGLLSRALLAALGQTLDRGEQAILFLNRRGTSTFVMCRDCGFVVECPRCDIPLTYHMAYGESRQPALTCHHCGRQAEPPHRCPQCGSSRIRYFGAGTERVQAYTEAAFPNARVLRWDRDTVRSSGGHEAILHRFLRHEADVLIGTQMVAKGLDLPLVTLVGVVSADVSLFFPDFRAGERAFQLLTQVAGRAGRREGGGQAIVQTYHPDHYAVQAAARHDYTSFYAREIALRRRLGYPPFGHMVRLLHAQASARRAESAAGELAERLRLSIRREGIANLEVIGPAPCFYRRLRGRYRWHILLRGHGAQELLLAEPPPAGWRVDVDPLDFL